MDQQLQELHTRIENISKQKQFEADQTAVQAVQMEMLTVLRNIRSAMVASSADGGTITSAAESEAHKKQVESLEQENERLKLVNAKQRYRIDHLIQGMLELQRKLEEQNN
mmetsp:Transcript_15676/g.29575  ORF Transcript_15676/g.29575 Transcript_15676/m.29575 type:complete len:110 (-) Transcript_15676:1669-1998(-)